MIDGLDGVKVLEGTEGVNETQGRRRTQSECGQSFGERLIPKATIQGKGIGWGRLGAGESESILMDF